ncbi:MAG: methyl-accepting chemotaxis protein, partial [Ruminococcus sp.]|nr:methyl-accepting chemotaxis protein [Ruminococcus sp.]
GFASASEELSSQSLILKNMIARFRLSEDDAEPAPAPVKKNIDPFDLLDAQEGSASEPSVEKHTELTQEDMEILGFTSDDDDKY